MIVRRNSLILRALERLANPTMYLPQLFPFYVEPTTKPGFCRITFRRP
jgi:hypothetical protein